jgi:hypothetical protein
MPSPLNNFPSSITNTKIGIADGRQPVSDHKTGAPFQQLL